MSEIKLAKISKKRIQITIAEFANGAYSEQTSVSVYDTDLPQVVQMIGDLLKNLTGETPVFSHSRRSRYGEGTKTSKAKKRKKKA